MSQLPLVEVDLSNFADQCYISSLKKGAVGVPVDLWDHD